jgi:hypothetical protein
VRLMVMVMVGVVVVSEKKVVGITGLFVRCEFSC